jgi:hypothetical protein
MTTSTSASIIDTNGIVLDPLPVAHTLAAISVNSTAVTSGPISYTVQTAAGAISGTSVGPVVAPEPSAASLVTASLTVWFGIWLKRCSGAKSKSKRCR